MVSKSQGYTLIELVVTVTIVGILAAIAVPSFSSIMAQSRAKTAADALYVSLLKARSTAATMNIDVTMAPVTSGAWASGWQVSCLQSSTNNCQNNGSNLLIVNQEALSGVTISAAATSVVYLTSGRTSGAANFSITAGVGSSTVQMCVSADSGGHPKVSSSLCASS